MAQTNGPLFPCRPRTTKKRKEGKHHWGGAHFSCRWRIEPKEREKLKRRKRDFIGEDRQPPGKGKNPITSKSRIGKIAKGEGALRPLMYAPKGDFEGRETKKKGTGSFSIGKRKEKGPGEHQKRGRGKGKERGGPSSTGERVFEARGLHHKTRKKKKKRFPMKPLEEKNNDTLNPEKKKRKKKSMLIMCISPIRS